MPGSQRSLCWPFCTANFCVDFFFEVFNNWSCRQLFKSLVNSSNDFDIHCHKRGQTYRSVVGAAIQTLVTLRRVRVVILCIWLVAALSGLLFFFTPFDVSIKLNLTLAKLSFVISLVSNTKIFFILRHQQAQLQDSVQQGQPNAEGIPLNIARYKKIVSTIIWVQLASVVCYLPFIITIIIITTFFDAFSRNLTYLLVVTFLFLNSSFNPIIYCWKIRDVRQQVKSTISQFFCSLC